MTMVTLWWGTHSSVEELHLLSRAGNHREDLASLSLCWLLLAPQQGGICIK